MSLWLILPFMNFAVIFAVLLPVLSMWLQRFLKDEHNAESTYIKESYWRFEHCGVRYDGRAERNTYTSQITLDGIFALIVLGKFVYLLMDYLCVVFPCFWPSLFVQAKVTAQLTLYRNEYHISLADRVRGWNASSCQISSKDVNPLHTYCDFFYFSRWQPLLSWISEILKFY